jgi:hypothetical protein
MTNFLLVKHAFVIQHCNFGEQTDIIHTKMMNKVMSNCLGAWHLLHKHHNITIISCQINLSLKVRLSARSLYVGGK